jgi:4-hydroxy-3-methylbut-2-enyl diphosphate reductase
VENETEIDPSWFSPEDKVGICGATSTPMWLMEQVLDYVQSLERDKVLEN